MDFTDEELAFIEMARTKVFSTHQMTIESLCKELSCSQTWAREHIIKNLAEEDRLYIKPRYLRKIFGNHDHGMEMIYLNEEAIRKYIYEHTTFSRQTILIPFEEFVDDIELVEMRLFERFREDSEEPKCLKYIKSHLSDYVTPTGKEILEKALTDRDSRKKAPSVNVEFPYDKFALDNLLSLKKSNLISELRDYRGRRRSDEMYYRLLFRKGAIKATIEVPDQDGVIGTKIMYLPNNDKITSRHAIPWALIPYAAWLEINDEQEIQEIQEIQEK